ncbi:MAG: methylmalonyl-CoA decarboxylase subunit alpha [Chloroflexota bacterium]|jgi:acetyl-CoA carboxylase carboxyltransferase component|nr:methylmalonyl-CoA decarboxylase subunit alpha [Chloroflexota bacterium]
MTETKNPEPATEQTGLDALVADLQARREKAMAMGGEEKVARQHERNKLTARERLDLLFDAGTFQEFGMLATGQSMKGEAYDPEKTAADGVVTGHGKVDGRDVYVAAYDFTVMAGSMGMIGEQKVGRLRDLALRNRCPIVWLLDSAGARIQDASGSMFAGTGYLFWDQVNMSGVIPQVAGMLGPCAAGTAYIPGLSDFVPMVKETSSMSLGGSRLVKAATGEDVTDHEMGGSQVHCYESGVGDLEVEDDAACILAIKEFLSFLPSNNREEAPPKATDDPPDRLVEGLEKIVPANMRQAYDMRKVIRKLADDGHVFEIKPTWAKNIITAFVRLGGQSVGVVANQPMHKAGALDNDSADKAARFIRMCDAFNIPLLFLQDVPGFIVGKEVEKEGIIRHGAKMLYAVSEATVPKITVIVRKAYGAGYFVMCGKGYYPDLIVAWPTAEISVMGPEGAVNIIFNKQVEAADDPDAARAMFVDMIRQQINPYIAANWAMIDDVITPAETRKVIIQGLDIARRKQVERPWRKHGNIPV